MSRAPHAGVRFATAAALLTAGLFTSTSYGADGKSRADDPRPNVVVILVDDLGYGDLSVQGGRDITTPNIDSIAKSGVRFSNGYVTGPYCSPTRAGLISGRYQERHGHDFNPDAFYEDGPEIGLSLKESTIADAFRSAKYRTGAVGKWHLGVAPKLRPQARGFDEFYGFLPAAHPYVAPATQPANAPRIPGQGGGSILRGDDVEVEPLYLTDALAREGAAFIKRNKDQPFFLYFATNAVHAPMQATEKYLSRFPNVEGKRKTYLAMLSALDDAVGEVLNALRETGVEENTLIYFLSDNGGPELVNGSDNGPLNGGKATVLEGGVRVPFFVQWKARLPQGVTIDRPVAQIDIFPTSIAAAGIPTPNGKNFDGKNILLLAEQKVDEDVHERLFWRFGQQWAVREGYWKLAKPPGAEKPQLFDLSSDIGETTDRAWEHPDVVERLTKAWNDWNRDNTDPRWVPKPQQKQKQQKNRAAKVEAKSPAATAK